MWKDIPGYEGVYQVSNLGRVKSLDRVDSRGRQCKGALKTLTKDFRSSCAKRVDLGLEGNVKRCSVKQLVAAAFIPGYSYDKNGVWCVDGNESNFTLANLTIDPFSVPLPATIKLAHGEVMKDIPNYEERYAVTSRGRVFRKPWVDAKGRALGWGLMTLSRTPAGYLTVYLTGKAERKSFPVHRLVAAAFIPNPGQKPCVDHIDTDKANNNAENLRWVTQKENMSNAMTREKMSKFNGSSRKVVVLDRKNVGRSHAFDSVTDCARHLGVSTASISRWAGSQRTSHKFPNLVFSYAAPPSIKETINNLAQRMNSMSEQECLAALQEYLQEVATS